VKSAYDLAGTAIPKNTVTAEGDILYASGSATVARLGIGTADQVLGIAAGVPAWTTPAGGGGLTLIATGTPSAATTVSFTSIPTTYKHLVVRWFGVLMSNTNGYWRARVNGDTGSKYAWHYVYQDNESNGAGRSSGLVTAFGADASAGAVIPRTTTSGTAYNQQGAGAITIFDYADTSLTRNLQSFSWGDATGDVLLSQVDGYYSSTGTAITSIDFVRGSTETITGTFFLYGVS
jgi:hypothetical protein